MAPRDSLSLIDHFSVIEDPRMDRRKLHSLTDILVIAICAVICGADSGGGVFRQVQGVVVSDISETAEWHPVARHVRASIFDAQAGGVCAVLHGMACGFLDGLQEGPTQGGEYAIHDAAGGTSGPFQVQSLARGQDQVQEQVPVPRS